MKLFLEQLKKQRQFADIEPSLSCLLYANYKCWDPHPKVQALVRADVATRNAVAVRQAYLRTYAAVEAGDVRLP